MYVERNCYSVQDPGEYSDKNLLEFPMFPLLTFRLFMLVSQSEGLSLAAIFILLQR